jgi:UDP-glucose:(heptosyl)LPS alpha-1,3-glucosyltransferase
MRFIAWLFLNRLRRSGQHFDLVLSPGINCTDADVIVVHALFRRLAEIARATPGDAASPGFLRALHRRLYYAFVSSLERRIYSGHRAALAAVSRRTASLLEKYFGRNDVTVVHNGVDAAFFSPEARLVRRGAARQAHGLRPEEFVLLLIGNDWSTKGITTILEAMALLPSVPLRLFAVGGDRPEPHAATAVRLGVLDHCIWQPWGADVLDCYAAADAYVSPSREDAFPLPVLEAMACGLPVVTSSAAGTSEVVQHGANGFVLQKPTDARTLAQYIAQLHADSELRRAMGEAARRTAQECSWDRNAAALWQVLSEAALRKAKAAKAPPTAAS